MSAPLQISTRPALEVAIRILEAADLPTEDLTHAHVEHFSFAGSATQPTGLVGLEMFGEVALLRSLVVIPERRQQRTFLCEQPSRKFDGGIEFMRS